MELRWLATRALGPVFRALPPWYRLRAYSRVSGSPFASGIFSRRVSRAISPHGYRVELDLSDWMERFAAIGGSYYEIEATAVVQRLLEPGGAFLDIGGNLGFLSLTASALVGPQGRVIYVEPNAKLVDRFRETCRRNGIGNVEIVEAALGACEGSAALDSNGHHGAAKLRDGSGIRVIAGDSLADRISADMPLLVKIDVEGYEELALAGMPAIIARPDTSFLIEVTDEWLRARGGSAARLFETMAGYSAFLPEVHRTRGLLLSPISGPVERHQYDVLFTKAL